MKINLRFLLISISIIYTSCGWNNTEIGYRNSRIYFGQSKISVEKKLGKLKLDANGLNQGSNSIKDYLLIQDQIIIKNIILNPILYFSFNDNKLIRFNASYTIDDIGFQKNQVKKLIENISTSELPGLKELTRSNKNYIQNNELLYLKSIKIDTFSFQFNTINYSVFAIP